MLAKGKYKTKNGSIMTISGQYGGISRVDFNWFDEDNACCDCQPEAYDDEGYLVWYCGICGGGKAKLVEIKSQHSQY